MSKKAFITGILGQDGPYLAQLLIRKGYEVFGLAQNNTLSDFINTDYLGVTDKIRFVFGDIANKEFIKSVIEQVKPDEIYNLAGKSFVDFSWQNPIEATEINGLATLYILDAVRDCVPSAKFYQASTRELFGNNNDNGFQNEKTAFCPENPYAVGKLYAYFMVENYKKKYGLFCSNGILFNHESPLRGLHFVTRKISDGVARIKLGLDSKISLGNLDLQRDWGFAGDYVEAMWLMLQQGEPDNYVVATGETHSIREFLDLAFARVGIIDWSEYVFFDTGQIRSTEILCPRGDPSKAREKLSWTAKVTFEDLVGMMVDADMYRLNNK